MLRNLEHTQRIYSSLILALVWSLSVGGLFMWNNHLSTVHTDEMARMDAINAFNKDQSLRRWATKHGGVYLEALQGVEPSPYMEHIPERDVMTDSGRLLTLVNPATMLNMIMEDYSELFGVQGRLVSINPLNPKDMADPWETKAIEAFESGKKEVAEITSTDGKDYYRLIRPMIANEGCIKCHGFQGYEAGDVLGGVGIIVPIDHYRQSLKLIINGNIFSHGLTWLLGMIGLTTWHMRGMRSLQERALDRTKLAAAYDDLEKMVAARTVELEHARTTAEEANNTKSKFLAAMSHELRTPLNAILGFSGTMKEEVFGPIGNKKYKEYLDDIHHSGKHLLNLINDILDVSAIEEGALELTEEKVSLAKVVDESIQLLFPRMEFGKVTITSSIDKTIPPLFVDERRIKQVFLNLLSNAVKFTPEGGNVAVSAQINRAGSLCVRVIDTGIGMDDKGIKISLSRFGQTGDNLVLRQEGTGLGLPLAKKMMEEHGGTLEIVSSKGQGTTVTVSFPKERIMKL